MIRNNQKIVGFIMAFGIVLCSLFGVSAQLPAQDALAPSEYRGKQIFLEGKGSAPIIAVISGVDVPASVLPCGSCHGANGKGNAEGGVQPTDIRWASLTRSYQEGNREGRLHPPYDEISVKKAITMGIDPAGNNLNKNMPRYKISLADMADLIAYLKRVGSDLDQGLDAGHIKIGCLLPPGGMDNELVKTSAAIVRARFDQLNQTGGIYNRKINAVLYSETPESGSVLDFLAKEQPFALTSSFLPSNDAAILDYLDAQKIPLCGAIATKTPPSKATSPYVFYLYADLSLQLLALLDKAGTMVQTHPLLVIVQADSPADAALLEQVETTRKERHSPALEVIMVKDGMSAAALAAQIAAKKPEAIVFLNGCELRDLLVSLEALSCYPMVFAPGTNAGKQIFNAPKSFQKKVVLSYPTTIEQITDQGYQSFRELQKQYSLAQSFQNTQMVCLAATDLLLSGLKSCGNELSREKLVNALETNGLFHSGLIPDLNYTPNKRIGSSLVFLLELDIENRSLNTFNY